MSSTTYVLAGGKDRQSQEFGDKLARLVGQQFTGQRLRILSCFFATESKEWEKKAEDWGGWFARYFGSDIDYDVATPEDFLDQLTAADLIYLHGGTTALLEDAMRTFNDIQDRFKGKIIVGSSAGTNYLSAMYFSPKRRVMGRGSGIVDIAAIVHFGAESDGEITLTKEEWRDIAEEMQQRAKPGQPVVPLVEGSFSVFLQ